MSVSAKVMLGNHTRTMKVEEFLLSSHCIGHRIMPLKKAQARPKAVLLDC